MFTKTARISGRLMTTLAALALVGGGSLAAVSPANAAFGDGVCGISVEGRDPGHIVTLTVDTCVSISAVLVTISGPNGYSNVLFNATVELYADVYIPPFSVPYAGRYEVVVSGDNGDSLANDTSSSSFSFSGSGIAPTPEPTPRPSPVATPKPTPVPTPKPTVKPAPTPKPTVKPVATVATVAPVVVATPASPPAEPVAVIASASPPQSPTPSVKPVVVVAPLASDPAVIAPVPTADPAPSGNQVPFVALLGALALMVGWFIWLVARRRRRQS